MKGQCSYFCLKGVSLLEKIILIVIESKMMCLYSLKWWICIFNLTLRVLYIFSVLYDLIMFFLLGAALGPKWQCANQTTLVSKQECSDFLNSCHTLLDLTGPLQLGALPAAASGQTQINIPPLDGCIRYEFIVIIKKIIMFDCLSIYLSVRLSKVLKLF